MMNSGETEKSVDTRLRTMRILWAVFLATIAQFALIAYFANPLTGAEPAEAFAAPPPGGPPPLLYLFFALGLASVAASYVLRQKFYGRAEREGRPELVQTGLIVALALCEVSALLGVAALFALGSPLAYSMLVLAVVGDLFHFPRRDQLLAASHKTAGR